MISRLLYPQRQAVWARRVCVAFSSRQRGWVGRDTLDWISRCVIKLMWSVCSSLPSYDVLFPRQEACARRLAVVYSCFGLLIAFVIWCDGLANDSSRETGPHSFILCSSAGRNEWQNECKCFSLFLFLVSLHLRVRVRTTSLNYGSIFVPVALKENRTIGIFNWIGCV